MPWQLIYTSAPRGLLSGQSGFCTVARSADLREALVQRLEQLSSYHYLRVAEAATASRNPTVSAFRLLDFRGAKYYVLTRIQPCGLDFTARTNHLAHHLIFQPDELTKLPSPAAILRLWPGWLASWQGEPRLLEEVAPASFAAAAAKNFLPAQTWARLAGDGGRAAGLLESECVRGCYLVCPPGSEEQVLQMYCETLQLLNFNGQFPLRPWRHTFTAFLQAEDNPNDFQWRGCQENTPAYKQALTRSAPLIALSAVRVPANSLVKLARDESKPPQAPPSSPKPPASEPPPKSSLKTTAREPAKPYIYNPPPTAGSLNVKKPTGRPALLNLNFSLNSATLAGLGIFVAVLAGLWMVKLHSEDRTAGQGSAAPVFESHPAPMSAPPPKESAPMAATTEPKPLDCLAGEGPTYVLTVPNLTNFSLPIDSISPFQNLLHRYDKLEPGALPNDIRLEVDTDRWDFPPGARMNVDERNAPRFSASLGVSECVFDYSGWLDGKSNSLKVQANFNAVTRSFSIHFGFTTPSNGDPFRLLIVNENNPPAPMRMAGSLVQSNQQELGASLAAPMRDCLLTNFNLLSGRRWQLRPYYLPTRTGSAQYLYKDWPAGDVPVFGCELDFSRIARRLRAQREDWNKTITVRCQPTGPPLGKWLELTNVNLESFPSFAPTDLTRSRFLDYLRELKKTSPTNAWIRRWNDDFDADQPSEASAAFQRLYDLWSAQRPQDQTKLTVTNAGETTNYFFATWQLLKERQQAQDELDHVQKRLGDLDKVAYVGLCIVDPMQPRMALEMIRFEGP